MVADGRRLGGCDGYFEGIAVFDADGRNVGFVVGFLEGIGDFFADGKFDGLTVGKDDGLADFNAEGNAVGLLVTGTVGRKDGFDVGLRDGMAVVERAVGAPVGRGEGLLPVLELQILLRVVDSVDMYGGRVSYGFGRTSSVTNA